MDHDIRQMLRERADEMSTLPALPQVTLQRAKRRRVQTMIGAGGVTLAVILGTIVGVNAIRGPAQIPFYSSIRPVLRHTISLQGAVEHIRPGYGSVWVQSNEPGGTLDRIDPSSGDVVKTFRPGLLPPAEKGKAPRYDRRIGSFDDLAVGQGAMWTIANPLEEGPRLVGGEPAPIMTQGTRGRTSATFSMTAQAIGTGEPPPQSFTQQASPMPRPYATLTPVQPKADQNWRVVRVDPRNNRLTIGPEIKRVWRVDGFAAGEGAVWAAGGWGSSGSLYRIDPRTMKITHTTQVAGIPHLVTVGTGSVWVGVQGSGSDASHVLRIDPRTAKIVTRIAVPDYSPLDLAVYNGYVWGTSLTSLRSNQVRVFRIDVTTNVVSSTPTTILTPSDLVSGAGYLWAPLGGAQRVVWIDATSGEVAGTLKLDGDVGSAAVVDRFLVVNKGFHEGIVLIYALRS